MTTTESFKDQGNSEFKAGNWLKAAALYSKGLKEDPGNAVLLSNRSAALLKLNKVQKALVDAEECIRLRPEWEKGHFRKANVLETIGKYEEALGAYQESSRCAPDSKEVGSKIKALTRLLRSSGGQNGHSHARSLNGSISSGKDYESARSHLVKGKPIPASKERIEEFGQRILELVEDEIQRKTFDRSFPSVFFLPGHEDLTGSEKLGQVSIQAAFDSPETLASALEFLRGYGSDTASQAAAAVVPKHRIAYPQVWQKAGWPLGKGADGLFVQLEAPGVRRVWFMPLGQKNREPIVLKDRFALVEALFR